MVGGRAQWGVWGASSCLPPSYFLPFRLDDSSSHLIYFKHFCCVFYVLFFSMFFLPLFLATADSFSAYTSTITTTTMYMFLCSWMSISRIRHRSERQRCWLGTVVVVSLSLFFLVICSLNIRCISMVGLCYAYIQMQ